MPTIQQLSQRRPEVDVEELKELRALYGGGRPFDELLTRFLPTRPHEPSSFYDIRKREAVYRNYLAPIIDYFTALLFSSRPVAVAKARGDSEPVNDLDEFYGRFREDADRSGTDVDAICKWLLTEAMTSRCSWVRLHHATDDGDEPANRAEFESRKLGDSWLEKVCTENVLDWDVDESGRLSWALVYSCSAKRVSLSDGHDSITETWEHLLPDRVDTYQVSYRKGERPDPETTVAQLPSKPHRFGSVPLVCLELPVGLWVANRLKSPQLAHFRLTNAQQWGMFTTCYAQPVYKLLDQTNVPTMGAGFGIVLGAQEDVSWLAPPSAPYEALGQAIRDHKDEIFRIAQNMALGVENNAASVGRSAESKQADAQATRVVLLAYSRIVKEIIERIYDSISAARGDDLEWSIEGLDDFAAADIAGLVEVLERVEKSGGIPSKRFHVEMKSRLAESLLPDMSQETKQTIRAEIASGISDQSDDAKASREMERLKAISGALDGESAQAKNRKRQPPPAASQAQ